MTLDVKCKNCKYWRDDATNLCCSVGMKVCHGLLETWIFAPGFEDGRKMISSDFALTETIEIYDYSIEPKFITGPEFGCINFEGIS